MEFQTALLAAALLSCLGPAPEDDEADPLRNVLGFILGGGLTIAVPIAAVVVGVTTGLSLANQALGAGVMLLVFLRWKWPAWSQPTKQFVWMVLLGVVVGCGFIGVAYYNMREMNSGWFQ